MSSGWHGPKSTGEQTPPPTGGSSIQPSANRGALSDITPAPAPMSADAMLLALIKANKAERAEVQEAIDTHTQEALRLDAIRQGLDAALKAVRFPLSSGRPSA